MMKRIRPENSKKYSRPVHLMITHAAVANHETNAHLYTYLPTPYTNLIEEKETWKQRNRGDRGRTDATGIEIVPGQQRA